METSSARNSQTFSNVCSRFAWASPVRSWNFPFTGMLKVLWMEAAPHPMLKAATPVGAATTIFPFCSGLKSDSSIILSNSCSSVFIVLLFPVPATPNSFTKSGGNGLVCFLQMIHCCIQSITVFRNNFWVGSSCEGSKLELDPCTPIFSRSFFSASFASPTRLGYRGLHFSVDPLKIKSCWSLSILISSTTSLSSS